LTVIVPENAKPLIVILAPDVAGAADVDGAAEPVDDWGAAG
jgi:hypothetical protein